MWNNPSSSGVFSGAVKDIITACLACGPFHCWRHPPPAERDAQEKPGKRPVGREGRAVHSAGSVSFSSSLTCQATFLEPGSGRRASGGPHGVNPGALGGIASTSGVKDPRVLQKGGVKTEVCFKGGTPKYGVSEVWAWRAHCLCTERLQITCLHMVSPLPDFLTHFPLAPIQVLCSTSSLFLHCSEGLCVRPLISRNYKWISVSQKTFSLLLLLMSTFYYSDPAYLFPPTSNPSWSFSIAPSEHPFFPSSSQ